MRAEDLDDFWSMPAGESIYTHAPEPKGMMTGTATTLDVKRKRKARRIGFKPPQVKR